MTSGKDEDMTLAFAPDAPELTEEDVVDYDPRVSVEAQLLCSLLWVGTGSPESRRVVDTLTATDFYRPVHAELFTVIADLVVAGRPHDSAAVFTTLQKEGRVGGHLGKQLTKALADITTVGVPAGAIEHYLDAVLTQAYRRGFRAAAQSLTEAAETLPEDQLFEHLLTIGRERRAATNRLRRIREGRA